MICVDFNTPFRYGNFELQSLLAVTYINIRFPIACNSCSSMNLYCAAGIRKVPWANARIDSRRVCVGAWDFLHWVSSILILDNWLCTKHATHYKSGGCVISESTTIQVWGDDYNGGVRVNRVFKNLEMLRKWIGGAINVSHYKWSKWYKNFVMFLVHNRIEILLHNPDEICLGSHSTTLQLIKSLTKKIIFQLQASFSLWGQ